MNSLLSHDEHIYDLLKKSTCAQIDLLSPRKVDHPIESTRWILK